MSAQESSVPQLAVVDVETTGRTPADRAVEIAVVRLLPDGLVRTWSTLVNPGMPIDPAASALHGITDAMVASAPTLPMLEPELRRELGGAAPAAHVARFDRLYLPQLPAKWLCTHRLARKVWPSGPANYKNATLHTWLALEPSYAAGIHRALPDALMTAAVLRRAIDHLAQLGRPTDAASLIAYADAPCRVSTMPFGCHRGKLLTQLPRDYIEWTLANLDWIDADLRWSLEEALSSTADAQR